MMALEVAHGTMQLQLGVQVEAVKLCASVGAPVAQAAKHAGSHHEEL